MLESPRGAYGFRLHYADPEENLDDLVVLREDRPTVKVSWRHACSTEDLEEVGEDQVTYGARRAAALRVERDPLSIRFDLPEPPVPGALVHPFLTVGISILARWRGDVTLHAGAFETAVGAWGMMGARQAGKSAMLAALAGRGLPIVADDLLTIQEGTVWAGPDCVDLRPDTAARFPEARYLGIVGRRPRFRLSTPPSRDRAPLRGFFVLDWFDDGAAIEVESLSVEERLAWVYRQEYIPLVGYSDPAQLLPLIGLPTWRVSRPRDWSATQEVIDRMLEVASDD